VVGGGVGRVEYLNDLATCFFCAFFDEPFCFI
jgi:hypothetical protein